MTKEKLMEIGVRQQEKAKYKNWAEAQLAMTCESCEACGFKSDCEFCPVMVAHRNALDRIANKNSFKGGVALSETPVEPVKEKKPVGDIRDLEISYTLRKKFENANITTISELAATPDEALLQIRGVGKGTIQKVREAIAEMFPEKKQKEKRVYNAKISAVFERKYYTPEEWDIIKILVKKGEHK